MRSFAIRDSWRSGWEGKPLPVWVRIGNCAAEPPDDRLSLSCRKVVGGAGSLVDAAPPKEGPKTFSNDLSPCWLTGGEAEKGDAGKSDELPCRRKKGLLALMVDAAGLITGVGLCGLDEAASARAFVSSSMLLFKSSASLLSFSRSPSFVASCFLFIATRPFCCRASDLSFSNAGFSCATSALTTRIRSLRLAFSC